MGRNAQTLHGPQAKRRVNQVSNGLSLATSNETTLASGISHQPCVSVATMAVYSTQVSHGVLSCSFLPYTNAPLGLPNRGWHGLMKVFLLTFVTNNESTSNLDSCTLDVSCSDWEPKISYRILSVAPTRKFQSWSGLTFAQHKEHD